MQNDQLRDLHQKVHAAHGFANRPFEPGETSRPITFFTDHLDDDGWRLGWSLVAALRADHADLFGIYGEETLHHRALSLLLERSEPPSLDELADALRAGAEEGPWLVSVPLANVSLDRPWAALGDGAVLWRTHDFDAGEPDAEDPAAIEARSVEDVHAEFAVFDHLGDRIRPTSRVLRFSNGTEFDTRRSVALVIKQEGPLQIAIEAARAKAHYAVATWSVLSPPANWHLLPDLGVWSPQPFMHERARYKLLEDGQWVGAKPTRGGDLRRWAPYDLPDDDVLAAPFEAFEHLGHRSAQALLSGTTALYAAGRASRAPLSERIRDARAAIECLCEPADNGNARPRWERLAARFSVWDRLSDARSYTPEAVVDLQQRLVNARNIGAHGADAALIDLGWIAGDRTLKFTTAPATDLAYTALQRDLGPLLFATGEALRAVWDEMRRAAFDDAAFEALFA